MKLKTAGREPTCDLVLEDPTVSRVHVKIELADDGHVFLLDADSSNGTFLQRNDGWIRVKRVSLCIGDRIRMGEKEVSLEHLTAVFGKRSKARLGPKHFSLRRRAKQGGLSADWSEPESLLHKPRRNLVTGRIEEDKQ